MRGTWQTSGPGLGVPVVLAAVAIAVIEFILSIIVWLAIALGVVLVLAIAALVVWRVKTAPKRRAASAAIAAAFDREALARRTPHAVTATAVPLAVEQHVHYETHYHAAPEGRPAVIRGAAGREELTPAPHSPYPRQPPGRLPRHN